MHDCRDGQGQQQPTHRAKQYHRTPKFGGAQLAKPAPRGKMPLPDLSTAL